MKAVIGVYGAGGFGREVMALLPSVVPLLFPKEKSSEIYICFIDDQTNKPHVNGVDVLSESEFLLLNSDQIYYTIAIADCKSRKLVFEKMSKSPAKPITLIFDNVLVMKNSKIGDGSIIMPGVKISTSVNIGDFVHINFNSYIAHDCVIKDFVTVSPGVICCGHTIINEGAFIGAGSTIKQGTSNKSRFIGENSILGIGSNLVEDLPSNNVFAGNPAKELRG